MRALLAILFVPALALAQEEPKPAIEAGGGFYFKEDGAVDVSNGRAWVSLGGIALPLPGKTSTGVMAEGGYDSGFVWSVWSANRTEIKRVIAGGDMRIARGGPEMGSAFDFDFRIVAGYRFTDNLAFYSYFLDDQTPVGFALGWKF